MSSPLPSIARRVVFTMLALLAFATGLPGCGGSGGGYAYVPAGTLEILNDPASFEAIVDIEVAETYGPFYAFFPDQYVLPGEAWYLDLYPSVYDVTLYWSDFFVETYRVDIYDGLTTTIFAFR